MTKRPKKSTSTIQDKRPRSNIVEPCTVNIKAKTPNDGYKSTHEILSQRIAERVDAKWAEVVLNLKKDASTSVAKPKKAPKGSEQTKRAEQPTGTQKDLHSMNIEQLQEIHNNLKEELQRLVAENKRIRAYAKEKFSLDEL